MKNEEIQEFIDYAKQHEESASPNHPEISLLAALVILTAENLRATTDEPEDEKPRKGFFKKK